MPPNLSFFHPTDILREAETGGKERIQLQLPSFLKAFCLKQALAKTEKILF